jgi:hypothetical protein
VSENPDIKKGGGAVGYGRPPEAHRFRAGQSGNPRGRPKGSKSESSILESLLNKKISVRQADRLRKMTVREAILSRFVEAALKGDVKAAAFLLDRAKAVAKPKEPTLVDDPADIEILEAFARDLKQSFSEEGGGE